jgi:hypothetical protein
MVARCTDTNHQAWDHYGSKGVTVSRRWLAKDGFQNFLLDMGIRPPNTSLGRVLDGNLYSKKTCEWQTPAEQGAHVQGHHAAQRLHAFHEGGRK